MQGADFRAAPFTKPKTRSLLPNKRISKLRRSLSAPNRADNHFEIRQAM